MEIQCLDIDSYFDLRPVPSNTFGNEGFVRLNAPRAERLLCLTDGRLGIVMGQRTDGVIAAPWSAPYFAIDLISGDDYADATAFGDAVRRYLADQHVRLVAPPLSHSEPENSFLRGFRRPGDTIIDDTSFHCDLAHFSISNWDRNQRRSLNKALDNKLTLRPTDDVGAVYDLIANHHAALGYPMAMTRQAVLDTSRVVPIDCWQVLHGDNVVAAAYNYEVRPGVTQMINNGATDDGRALGATPFLLYSICNYYKELYVNRSGISDAIMDHGPTSVMGQQNPGLVRFKTSVGFIMTTKTTLLTP